MADLRAHAPDISCEGCANAIQRALNRLDGVERVQVDVPSQDVIVEYRESKVSREQILTQLSNAGYDATLK